MQNSLWMQVDVRDLRPGDVIADCAEDGWVTNHRPNVNFPDQERVYFANGVVDDFGAPQNLYILRPEC